MQKEISCSRQLAGVRVETGAEERQGFPERLKSQSAIQAKRFVLSISDSAIFVNGA
jgi:hypothetical protein